MPGGCPPDSPTVRSVRYDRDENPLARPAAVLLQAVADRRGIARDQRDLDPHLVAELQARTVGRGDVEGGSTRDIHLDPVAVLQALHRLARDRRAVGDAGELDDEVRRGPLLVLDIGEGALDDEVRTILLAVFGRVGVAAVDDLEDHLALAGAVAVDLGVTSLAVGDVRPDVPAGADLRVPVGIGVHDRRQEPRGGGVDDQGPNGLADAHAIGVDLVVEGLHRILRRLSLAELALDATVGGLPQTQALQRTGVVAGSHRRQAALTLGVRTPGDVQLADLELVEAALTKRNPREEVDILELVRDDLAGLLVLLGQTADLEHGRTFDDVADLDALELGERLAGRGGSDGGDGSGLVSGRHCTVSFQWCCFAA